MKILDCTLRDGGYYTNWDFDRSLVKLYLSSFENLPVDYLEIGYRNPVLAGYFGEYFFCKRGTLDFIKDNTTKKLAIILDEKNVQLNDLDTLLDPCVGIIEMVRIAIDPSKFERALELAIPIKLKGFKIAFNIMYMSSWDEHPNMIENLEKLNGLVDYLYLVDSFGGIFPEDVIRMIRKIKQKTTVKLGFHGHNNLEMALANTLAAVDEGIDIVDSTVTGMGRGAGNLKTELLLTALHHKLDLRIDYDSLSSVSSEFSDLQKRYQWGTSLPYMVSGARSLPQKQVMEWISKRYYSMNSITRALNTKINEEVFPKLNPKESYESALIIGGGLTVGLKRKEILEFCNSNRAKMVVVHASSKNSNILKNVNNKQCFCLLGNEGVRLEKVFENLEGFEGTCVLPPPPREMGTYVPRVLRANTYELCELDFIGQKINSHLTIALQTSLLFGVKTIYLAGFDGYYGESISEQLQELFVENSQILKAASEKIDCISLTPTKYEGISQSSIYNFIK